MYFAVDEVRDYWAGQLPPRIVVTCAGSAESFWFDTELDGTYVAFIPREGSPDCMPFSIRAALAHPSLGVQFDENEHYFRVVLSRPGQIHTVFGLACNHLHWLDYSKVMIKYKKGITANSGQSQSPPTADQPSADD
jgi:hypothetical protein